MKKVILGLFSFLLLSVGITSADYFFQSPFDYLMSDGSTTGTNLISFSNYSNISNQGISVSFTITGSDLSNFYLDTLCFAPGLSQSNSFSISINGDDYNLLYDSDLNLMCVDNINLLYNGSFIISSNQTSYLGGINLEGPFGYYTNNVLVSLGDGYYLGLPDLYDYCGNTSSNMFEYCFFPYYMKFVIAGPDPVSCNFIYGNGLSGSFTSDQVLTINGYSTLNGTTITPYFNISYTDQDNQVLTESYDKTNLILGGKFEKTYTGGENNFWVLTALGSSVIPDIIFTGSTLSGSSNISGNIFTNFVDNSFDVIGTNIPNFISYGFVLIVLIILIRLIRHFKKGGKGRI